MICDVPADTPVTIPVEPIVATAVLPLAQAPPVDASLNEVVAPWHTAAVPDIAAGNPLTVTIVVARQPVGSE